MLKTLALFTCDRSADSALSGLCNTCHSSPTCSCCTYNGYLHHRSRTDFRAYSGAYSEELLCNAARPWRGESEHLQWTVLLPTFSQAKRKKTFSCEIEIMKMNQSWFLAVTAAFLMVAIPLSGAQIRAAEVCAGIDCQQGTCVPLSNNSYPSNILSPYLCTCKLGWRTVEGLVSTLPHLTTLPCTVPNCTLKLGCNGSPAPPLQSPPTLEHISSPCSLPGICGQGECEVTDLTKYPPMYKCNCHSGYANVGNLTAGYCLKDCEIGTNCRAIGITLPSISAGSCEASAVSSFHITLAVIASSCFVLLYHYILD